jgi:nuclear GTP-binding protein
MGTEKRSKHKFVGRVSKSNSSMNPDRPASSAKGGQNMRDKATINRLKMYKSGGKAIRDKTGKVIRAAPYQSTLAR